MVRFAVIGSGWIARTFVEATRRVPGLQFAAMYSRTESTGRRFADYFDSSIPVYTDLEQLAHSATIDAVYIASPNHLHYAQSKLFLEHGKHVLCEKPVTVGPEELDELQALAAARDLIYLEAIMLLHLPQRHILRTAVSKLGRIRSAHIDFSQFSTKYAALLSGQVPNIFNPACCTGTLMDLGVYTVYLAAWLWGRPEHIQAQATFLYTGADAAGTCVLSYPEHLVTLTYSKVGQDRLGSQILGDQGTLTFSSCSQLTDIRLWQHDDSSEELWGSGDHILSMTGEAQDFYRYITDPAGTRSDYEEAAALALTVSHMMAEIRAKAEIYFHK